jgi:peptidase M15-like protein
MFMGKSGTRALALRVGALAVVVLLTLGFGGVEGPVPAAPAPGDSLQGLISRITGLSGKLRAIALFPSSTHRPGATIGDLVPALGETVPGVQATGLTTSEGDALVTLGLVPLAEKRGTSWRGYRVGYWPRERSRRLAGDPTLPAGFIEVTPDNQDTRISAHFRLRDFLTHDQQDRWPKVLVLRLALIDKLELIRDELARRGKPAEVRIMSGFRTPQYNAEGVGPGGRARDSRHMYGDASDIFVDADGDGRMDDLDGDGRVTVADARYLLGVAESVESRYPSLIGGMSAYRSTAAHGPFLHVDVRGTPARW